MMKIGGWEVRSGVANPRKFQHAGIHWVHLVKGVSVWYGIAPFFMFFFACWESR